MKYKELKTKTVEDLKVDEKGLRAELFQLRLKHSTSQLEKKSNLCLVRRNIARIRTKMSELALTAPVVVKAAKPKVVKAKTVKTKK